MITVNIGGLERHFRLGEVDENWINQQVNGLQRDRRPVCVRITFQEPSVNFTLATIDCGGARGGVHNLSAQEKRVLEIWSAENLGTDDTVNGGKIVAFLKKIRSVLA